MVYVELVRCQTTGTPKRLSPLPKATSRRRPEGDNRRSRCQGTGQDHPRRPGRDRPPRDLAAQFLDDLRRLDTQLAETRKKLAAAVRAPGTSVTEVSGAGPVSAGTVIGDAGDISRFPQCRGL